MTQMLVGALARWALGLVTTYLVAHHVLTAAEGDTLFSHGMEHAIIVAPAVAALAWSLYQKYQSRISFLTALAASAGTAEGKVQESIAAGYGVSLTKVPAILLALALVGVMAPACASAPPTKVAAVADIGAKIEASAGALLSQAQTASATVNPVTGRTFISRDQLDVVAIAVDKVGRMGLLLEKVLRDYNAAKAAGADASAQVLVVQQTIADMTSALNLIGKSIPSGTVADIDQAVVSVFGIIAQAKAAVSL